jgi:hypothetical protein
MMLSLSTPYNFCCLREVPLTFFNIEENVLITFKEEFMSRILTRILQLFSVLSRLRQSVVFFLAFEFLTILSRLVQA